MNHCSIDTAKRLLKYANLLRKHLRNGRDIISAKHLSTEAGVDTTTLREDIFVAGASACSASGYSVEYLIRSIESFLGCENSTDAVMVGTRETIESTKDRRCNVVAAFDLNDPARSVTGDNVQVFHISKLPNLVERMQVRSGILAVPPASAQHIVNMMVSSGITDIWNYSGVDVQLPDTVTLHSID